MMIELSLIQLIGIQRGTHSGPVAGFPFRLPHICKYYFGSSFPWILDPGHLDLGSFVFTWILDPGNLDLTEGRKAEGLGSSQ